MARRASNGEARETAAAPSTEGDPPHRESSRRLRAARGGRNADLARITISEEAGELFSADGPVGRVIGTLGNNVVATILGVSPS